MLKLPLLAAALLAGSLSPAGAKPGQFVVQLWSYGYAPSPIRLAAGKPVTMTFVNRSGSSHDFTAHSFFEHARITAGAAPDGEIDFKPRETKTITLIPAAGTYHAHCSHFFHKQLGMSVEILVS